MGGKFGVGRRDLHDLTVKKDQITSSGCKYALHSDFGYQLEETQPRSYYNVTVNGAQGKTFGSQFMRATA